MIEKIYDFTTPQTWKCEACGCQCQLTSDDDPEDPDPTLCPWGNGKPEWVRVRKRGDKEQGTCKECDEDGTCSYEILNGDNLGCPDYRNRGEKDKCQ